MKNKSLPWFRFYTEVADDPKIHRLSDSLYRFWVTCLCLAGRHRGILPSIDDIAYHMRKPAVKVLAMRKELSALNLLDESEPGTFTPHNWAHRQYEADVSTSRVKKFRERRKEPRVRVDETVNETFHETVSETDETVNETVGNGFMKRFPSASVSVSDSASESGSGKTAHFPTDKWAERLYARHPKKRGKPLVEVACVEIVEKCRAAGRDPLTQFLLIDRVHIPWCASADWTKENAKYCPQLAVWLSDEGWTAELPSRAKLIDYGPDTPSEMAVWRKEQKERLARGEEC